jgi:hypothetical protein
MILDRKLTLGGKAAGTAVGIQCDLDVLNGKTDEQIRELAADAIWIREFQDKMRIGFDAAKHEPFQYVRDFLNKAGAKDLVVGPWEPKSPAASKDPLTAVKAATAKANTEQELRAMLASIEAEIAKRATTPAPATPAAE